MDRIHLFEFEDYSWFPDFLRVPMTRYLVAIHKMLGTAPQLAEILKPALKATGSSRIIDLCSGGGGPMLETTDMLREDGIPDLQLTMTDLYPNQKAAEAINDDRSNNAEYLTTPVNAANVDGKMKGMRTMICSLHHMKPEIAKDILKDAMEDGQPICIYEISDNSIPHWIAWISFPINLIMVLLITLAVRPMTWQQVVFTYFIPLLPIFIAWDGMVSNMRTYTVKDLEDLTHGLSKGGYSWKYEAIAGKGGKKVYLLGMPA